MVDVVQENVHNTENVNLNKKLRIYNKISEVGLNLLSEEKYTYGPEISEPEAILLRSHKLKKEEIPSCVSAIGRAGAGVNNIPVEWATNEGIVVFNTPGANANAVKELVLSAMLLSCRNINKALRFVDTLDEKDNISELVEKQKKAFKGYELKGKCLGVVGLGAIGMMVANAAVSMGMTVYGYDPFLTVDRAWGLSQDVKPALGLESMMREADFVSVHIPYSEKTAGFISEERIGYLKKGAVLLNFARDGVIDENALLKRLEQEEVRYVTDFPTSSVIHKKGVVVYPHLGASTSEAEETCAVMVVNQIKSYLESGQIVNSVNFPVCKMPLKSGLSRLSIINKNVPDVIRQITSVLADQKINIDEMVNKSKASIAYSLIDFKGNLVESQLDALRQLDSVIAVRQINQ